MPGDYEVYESKMKKTLSALASEFATVRAGRANAGVLDQIRVDYYGEPTPIAQIASVTSPDPRTLVISPWDAGSLKSIEKAIQASELGINPANDGKLLRLAFPQLTEDRRRELTKLVAKYSEDARVAIRNIRRDAVETFKAQKKKSEITEDDLKDAERDIQKLTDNYVKEIDAAQAKKDKELLEI
ncbi:MAG: ribosome recycling factor [Oscillospiraceae bacterium]|jgi:ribosome recycling factor|nr:ribosome recycling factor [Oscillospiraceae bacterium]